MTRETVKSSTKIRNPFLGRFVSFLTPAETFSLANINLFKANNRNIKKGDDDEEEDELFCGVVDR